MKQTIRFLCLTLLAMVIGMAQAQNVAKIGDTEYATLQAAVDVAKALGDTQTINLLGNITTGKTVTIQEIANSDLTIDGQKDGSSNYTVNAKIIVDSLNGRGGSIRNGASNCKTIDNIESNSELSFNSFSMAEAPIGQKEFFYNPSQEPLRILHIGNSFTEDAMSYLNGFISSANLDVSNMCLYKTLRSSGSFKLWVKIFQGNDTENPTVKKVVGGIDQKVISPSSGNAFQDAICNHIWDLIIIQQVSTYSGNYEQWEGDGAGGYLKELINILKTYQPNAAIGFFMPHSPTAPRIPNTQNRWNEIKESCKFMVDNYGVDVIIPVGTAIENIRVATGNHLTRDGEHLGHGLGRYVASACYYQTIFAPRYGVSVLSNPYIHLVTSGEKKDGVKTDYIDGLVDVTSENAGVAQIAAFLACMDMYNIQNPNNTTIDELINPIPNFVAKIDDVKYETLQAAVDAAGTTETTISLFTEAATDGVISGDGVVVPSGSNITFDLNGLTYDVSVTTVGSTNTETPGFQLLKNSNITFKNGTLKATSPTAQMLIQNYSNLTLEDVNLDGTTLSGVAYALSNNSGTINLTGSTSITAKTGGRAFDTRKFSSYAIPTVNINTIGAITGPIEVTGGKLNIENGKFDVTWVTDNNYAAGDIQITGGVFSEEPADEYFAEDYVIVDNTDEATMSEYPYTVKSKEDAGIFDLFDDIDYASTDNVQANKVTYTRYFSPNVTNHYQAWYIPFDYTIKEEDADYFDFYKIHLISASNKQEQDDLIEDNTKVYIHIEPIEAETVLKANRPYVVKPKAVMTHVFESENVTLHGMNNGIRLSMSTSKWDYNIYGTYETFKEENQTANQWIGLNTRGNYFWNETETTLHRYRWYIKVSANTTNGDYAKLNLFFIEDNGEATDIKSVLSEEEIEGIYTLDGVKVQTPVKGMNIIRFTNGKTTKINFI